LRIEGVADAGFPTTGTARTPTEAAAESVSMPTASKKTASRKTSSRRSTSSSAKTKTSTRTRVTESSADHDLVWTGALDLSRAAELTEALKSALESNDSVTLTLRDVETADLSFVQILLAATHTAKSAGKSLRLVDESDEVEALCQEVGFGTVYQRLIGQEPEVTA
jgi:anti-anti-sigma regulatory factor